MNIAVAPASTDAVRPRLRVMIVDDATVVRGLFSRWVTAEADFEVVASIGSGIQAIRDVERLDPDVVVLDVDMPDMDGIAALPLLLEKRSDLVVIMASTLTSRNAKISLRALALGAADYIPKPTRDDDSGDFRRELIEKIRQLGMRRRSRRLLQQRRAAHVSTPFTLRTAPISTPRVLLIGASTGGPQALETVLGGMRETIASVPVLITQHIPPTFSAILAEHLARTLEMPVEEARDGQEILAGKIYLAPGGRHMRVVRHQSPYIAVRDGEPINYCKPAVDPLFSSAASVWGRNCLALVLTGMGHDGLAGASELIAAGASVVAQDEATSVVWGMPGRVAQAGLCSAVLPLTDIAPALNRIFAGERP